MWGIVTRLASKVAASVEQRPQKKRAAKRRPWKGKRNQTSLGWFCAMMPPKPEPAHEVAEFDHSVILFLCRMRQNYLKTEDAIEQSLRQIAECLDLLERLYGEGHI